MALGPKWGKKRAKNREKFGVFFFLLFFAIFGPFFSRCRAEGHFLFFGQIIFPIFGFRPVFHSIPGRLTRKL